MARFGSRCRSADSDSISSPFESSLPINQRLESRFDHRPFGEDRFDADDVIARRPDANGVRAGRVDSQHAADGRDGRAARIGRKITLDLSQFAVQVLADDARLNADGGVIDPFDGPHVAGEIDDDAGSQAAAGEARSGAAGDQRNALIVGVVGQQGDVVAASRPGDSERTHLMQAAVGGVLHARQRIEEQVALRRRLSGLRRSVAAGRPRVISESCDPGTRVIERGAAGAPTGWSVASGCDGSLKAEHQRASRRVEGFVPSTRAAVRLAGLHFPVSLIFRPREGAPDDNVRPFRGRTSSGRRRRTSRASPGSDSTRAHPAGRQTESYPAGQTG